jgi:hypothetical protein
LRDFIRDMIERDAGRWPRSQQSADEPPSTGPDPCGEKPLRLVDLRHLSEVLQIDRARAVVAIEILAIGAAMTIRACIMMRLIGPVVGRSTPAPTSHRAFDRAAENQLSDWLAKTIITNEEQIRHRRNEFVKLPNL